MYSFDVPTVVKKQSTVQLSMIMCEEFSISYVNARIQFNAIIRGEAGLLTQFNNVNCDYISSPMMSLLVIEMGPEAVAEFSSCMGAEIFNTSVRLNNVGDTEDKI
jgi:hypothetical protein